MPATLTGNSFVSFYGMLGAMFLGHFLSFLRIYVSKMVKFGFFGIFYAIQKEKSAGTLNPLASNKLAKIFVGQPTSGK